MTSHEQSRRNHQGINNSGSVFCVHHYLKHWVDSLDIQLSNSRVVLQGEVPTETHRTALVPAIRRAGVLAEVMNRVQIANEPLHIEALTSYT
ncbi:hypothetical protein N9069_00065 [bacterium]|nr:hypothetical protein [bacterium]